MDSILCDELLQEIFHHLPPSSSSAVSLVSKRWLRLLRSSTVALSLSFIDNPTSIDLTSLSAFLCHHSYLSSLSLTNSSFSTTTAVSSDHLLHSVAFSCPNLRQLRFSTDPVSSFSLLSLSASCPHLSSLTITLLRPLCFQWLLSLSSLKELSLSIGGNESGFSYNDFSTILDAELNLESLFLSGIQGGDHGLNFLWRNCKKLKKLKLKRCESVGDNASFSAFIKGLKTLQEVELRTCRMIADGVLFKLAEESVSLTSLLIYDGGSKEGLLHFINHSRSDVQRLDFRLPLDLDNDHLTAVAENFSNLLSLRLQSCCLVTGEGLKIISRALSDELQELALINCDMVEKESGLLATLGQNLKRLRKLDVSYNEMLMDKELSSMLVNSSNLKELNLRGCNRLTNVAMLSIVRSCKQLEIVDIMNCCGIEMEGVELFLLNSSHLRQLQVEESKLSVIAKTFASDKFIEAVAA